MGKLEETLLSNWQNTDNGAINTLLTDYKLYHGVIFVLFLFVALGSMFVGFKLFKKYRQAEKKSFESRSLMTGFIVSIGIFLFSSLLTFANSTNTFITPETGFQTMTETFKTSTNETVSLNEKEAFAGWVDSKEKQMPLEVKEEVNNWRIFHIKKASICAVILLILVSTMGYVWKYLVRKDELKGKLSPLTYTGFFALGLPSALLALMVIANIQGSISPLFSYLVKLT